MEKTAIEKYAFYVGKAQALDNMGFSENMIKTAFVAEGLSPDEADALVKEAVIGQAVGGALRWGSKLLGRGAAGLRKGVRFAQGARGPLAKGQTAPFAERAQSWGAKQLGNAAGAVSKAGTGMKNAPLQTLGRGAIEAGKGAMFGGGKGIGGAIGKGAFGASMYNMMTGPGKPQAPQAYGGSMMRNPNQGY